MLFEGPALVADDSMNTHPSATNKLEQPNTELANQLVWGKSKFGWIFQKNGGIGSTYNSQLILN